MTKSRRILSPMPTGSGAIVVHRMLEESIPGYRISPYNPYWELLPPMFPLMCGKEKPELIHTTPDYGFFFAKRDIPLILTLHNFVLDQFMRRYSSLLQRIHYKTDLKWFTHLSVRSATMITSVSNFTAELARKELGIKEPIRTIYNGIDVNAFTPAPRHSNKTIKILVSGNQTRRKGTNLIPLIANKLSPGLKILYTQGMRTKNILPPMPNLENIGSIPYKNMPAVYRDADILLFPTVREGFGLVIAEAMACGLPVVATNCSSIPELIIDKKGGFLCALGDVNDFAEKLNQLACDAQLRRQMGEFNRERANRLLAQDRMVQEYRDLFEEVMDKTC